ncbi:hypothetical protein BD779DRAFT_1789487 [Infundibulicybe gibba]|nr:hypothetical protein BD779DRAFT_1789487 [Infundibulicybe gibba]
MPRRESDEELRARVWTLLFDYSIKHITRDYVEFTEDAWLELCDFSKIPTTDPNSLYIPADPFDALSDIVHLEEIPPYEEKIQSNPDVAAYIKASLGTRKGKPKSDRVCYEDEYVDALESLLDPFEPILTLKSIRATPRLGASASQLPRSRRDLTKAPITKIDIEPFEEPDVNTNETLDVMWTMSAQDHSAVRSLFQATSLLSRPGPGYKNVYLDMTRPPPTASPPQRLDSPFIPIFARRDLPGSGHLQNTKPDALNLISNLPSILFPEREDANEHMAPVDGWRECFHLILARVECPSPSETFCTSSPPRLPSPTSSQGDGEIDQLLEVSSPNTELQPAELLEASKIDTNFRPLEDINSKVENDADAQASFGHQPTKWQRVSTQDVYDNSGVVLFNEAYDPPDANERGGLFENSAGDDPLELYFKQENEDIPPFQLLGDFGQYLEYDNPYPVVENSRAGVEYQLGYDGSTMPMDQAPELEGPISLEFEQVSRPQNNPSFRNPAGVRLAGAGCPTYDIVATGEMTMSREPKLARDTLGILTFAQLRGKQVQPVVEVQPAPLPTSALPVGNVQGVHVTPESLFDSNTLRLPSRETFQASTSTHFYMASLEIIQKQALIRALRLRECAVDLIERNSLDGMDFIIDPQTGVLFMSLFLLPSQCAALITRIAAQSWHFARILVVYEAYPTAHSYKERRRSGATPSPYTPPIMKALSKVRRDLDIAEACGNKRVGVVVQYAFANDVHKAAMFVRHYGELAENASFASVLWDTRKWLDEEVVGDEEALAGVGAMNRFSAAVVLARVGAKELLEMTPEARVNMFGPLIGYDVVDTFNSEMERRSQVLEPSDNADMSVVKDA